MSQTSRLWLWRLHRAREFRTLRDTEASPNTLHTVSAIDFSPDGRWLLGAVQGGSVSIWDTSRGRKLASVVTERDVESAFFDRKLTSFVTWERRGLLRWPLQIDGSSGRPVVGSPAFLGIKPRNHFGEAVLAEDGRTVALVPRRMRGDGLVLDLENPASRTPIKGRAGLFFVAVSPDSRLVASGPYKARGIHVWESATGKRVKDLPAEGSVSVGFSPDGRWLVAGGSQEYRLWEVGSWRPGLTLARDNPGDQPGKMAFSPDGTLAIVDSLMIVKLVDPATGRGLATLEAPDPEFIDSLRFSPSGDFLAAACGNCTIQIWDLARIRERLETMKLDW
jgi:WD40 repeat protein